MCVCVYVYVRGCIYVYVSVYVLWVCMCVCIHLVTTREWGNISLCMAWSSMWRGVPGYISELFTLQTKEMLNVVLCPFFPHWYVITTQ